MEALIKLYTVHTVKGKFILLVPPIPPPSTETTLARPALFPAQPNPQANPVMKEALNVMSVANSIVDEVVDRLLNEATEKILKEDQAFVVMI